jgi:hypothetical protein
MWQHTAFLLACRTDCHFASLTRATIKCRSSKMKGNSWRASRKSSRTALRDTSRAANVDLGEEAQYLGVGLTAHAPSPQKVVHTTEPSKATPETLTRILVESPGDEFESILGEEDAE